MDPLSMSDHRLLVIVISWNRCDFLRRTLNSLFERSDAGQTDVVVVDNGSDLPTRELIASETRLAGYRQLETNLGLNMAAELALSEWLTPEHAWVLLSDADMEYQVPVRLGTELLEQQPQIGAVSFQHSPEHPETGTLIYLDRNWPLKQTERGCSLLMSAHTLLRMRPLPVQQLKDLDWWICRDAPQSLQAHNQLIAVLPGGAKHLGWRRGDSTWQDIEIPEYAAYRT